ncbi:ABC transporter ATP-binding protein [Mycoplasmopsis sturni]|uniref:ABC transporter ATP-binding protein n=1 Tax=Mycoplasmopsis sturni TaxID=39047 RepID=UPI00068AC713|nr:ABC transporter ATP-binding protein [Mycoplasmopsis sturni]
MINYNHLEKNVIWRLTYGYRKLIFLTIFLVLLETICNVLMPFFINYLIKDGISKYDPISKSTITNFDAVLSNGLILILLAILGLIFGIISSFTSSKAASGYGQNLRNSIYYKVTQFSYENIDKFRTGALLNRLNNDVVNITNAFNQSLRILVRAPFMLILSLVFSITTNAQLSLMFLVLIPTLIILFVIIWFRAFPLYQKMFKNYDLLNQKIQENFQGMRTIKSYVTEDLEYSKVSDKIDKLNNIIVKAEKIVAFGTPSFSFIIYAAIVFLAIQGTNFILMGNIEIGDLVAFTSYIWQVSGSILILIMVTGAIVIAGPSLKRISEIIHETPSIDENLNGKKEVVDGSIHFKNVFFKYNNDKEYSLSNINLEVPFGSTLGIIGRTGSGKSTLISLIGRFYEATEGKVYVGETPVEEYNIHSLRDAVSFVFQKNILFSGTIRSNMLLAKKDLTDQEIFEALDQAGIGDYVRNLEHKLDTIVEQGGTNFSGGQKQRLCIARSLLKSPKILILDDSTSALDAKTELLIKQTLKNKVQNCTKIIISQKVNSISHADQIIVIEGGSIIAQGTHVELLNNNEFYKSIYQSQQASRSLDE